jgi:hypothetical protein
MSITDLSAFRELKKMGAPLNTPVEHRKFSRAYSECWFALNNARIKFLAAMSEYAADGSRTGSAGKWKLVRRRLGEIRKAILRGEALVDEERSDPLENDALANFLITRANPFFNYWNRAIAAIEVGASLVITPAELWTDD